MPRIGVASAVVAVRGAAALRVALAAVALAITAWHALGQVRWFVRTHPWHEVALVERLLAQTLIPFRVLTTYGYLSTTLHPGRCHTVHPPYGTEELATYGDRLVASAEERGATYAVFGRVSCGDAVFERLLVWEHPRLERREQTEAALLLAIRGIELDWIARFDAEPRAARVGPVRLEVELRRDVAAGEVAAVGVAVAAPDGVLVVQWLAPAGDNRWRGTLEVPAARPPSAAGASEWTLEPVVVSVRGRVGGGPRIVLTRP